MRNRRPCQRDAGTRLATALRRRPFSACNKGNRRRLHAGNKPTVKSCLFFKYVFIPREALTSSHCLVIWLKIVLSFRNQNYINSEKIYCFRSGVRYCCTRKKEVCVTPALIVFQHPAGKVFYFAQIMKKYPVRNKSCLACKQQTTGNASAVRRLRADRPNRTHKLVIMRNVTLRVCLNRGFSSFLSSAKVTSITQCM